MKWCYVKVLTTDSKTCPILTRCGLLLHHVSLTLGYSKGVYVSLRDDGRLSLPWECAHTLWRKRADSNYGFQIGKLVLSDLDSSYTRKWAKTTYYQTILRLMVCIWNIIRILDYVFNVRLFSCASSFTRTMWLAESRARNICYTILNVVTLKIWKNPFYKVLLIKRIKKKLIC